MNLRNKSFITGGYGFVGYHLAKHLLMRGEKVILFGHAPKDSAKFKALANQYMDMVTGGSMLEFRYGEMISDDLHKIVHEEPDIRMIYHLAAMKSTTATRDRAAGALIAHNFDVDIEVFDFCESILEHRPEGDQRPVKLIYVSTGEVYGDSFNRYPRIREESPCILYPGEAKYLYPLSKLSGEMMLSHGEWGFLYNIVRLQNPYGPGMGSGMLITKLIHAAMEANDKGEFTFLLASPEDSRPFIYIDDVAIALATIMDLGKMDETYNLCGMYSTKMSDLANLIAELFAPGLKIALGTNPAEHRQLNMTKLNEHLMGMGLPTTTLPEGLKQVYDSYTREYAVQKSMRDMGL